MLIERLDRHDGDADLLAAKPVEANGDEAKTSAIEWTTTKPYQRTQLLATDHEDDEEEEDDAAEDNGDERDGTYAAEDEFMPEGWASSLAGASCPIGDPGGAQGLDC